jgi:hypothetical protein
MMKITRLLTHRVDYRSAIVSLSRNGMIWSNHNAPSSLLTSRFSTVFQVNPQGETSITEHDDQLNQTTQMHRFPSEHVEENISIDDYYRGHLLCDQLEYVNDTIEKIEDCVNTLEDLNYRKRSVLTNTIGLMNDSSRNEMKKLFDQSTATKVAVKKQIQDMKDALKLYKDCNKKSFAVDAPDGLSDDCKQHEVNEVQKILLNTPTIKQRAATIEDLIRQSRNGVDAPDGTCDAMNQEDLAVIQYILSNSKKCTKS